MKGISFILLVIFLTFPLYANDSLSLDSTKIYLEKIEKIDPFAEGVGDFLDFDTNIFEMSAFDALQEEKYKQAAKYYIALLKYDIHDNSAIYNLACCYSLMGKEKQASKFLQKAVKAGFKDLKHIRQDPDFDIVRNTEIFQTAMDSISSWVNEDSKILGKLNYISALIYLKYRIRLPEDFDSTRTYPAVIGLHGYGSNIDRFVKLPEIFYQPDFIYIVPQAPYPFLVGKDLGYNWELWSKNSEDLRREAKLKNESYIEKIVKKIKENYKISDLYLLGFSQGAANTYTIGIKYPKLFTGLVCFGGWLDKDWLSEEQIKSANNLKVFIAHGKEDPMVEFATAENARDYLQKLGYNVTFYEFEGGHTITEEAVEEVSKWMQK